MIQLTQEQLNLVVKCIVFTVSTDACMGDDEIKVSDVKELLQQFHYDCPGQMCDNHLALGDLYIHGEREWQEDIEMNDMLKVQVPNLHFNSPD